MKFETFYWRGKRHFEKGHKLRAKLYRIFCKVAFNCDVPFQLDIAEDVYFCHNAFGVVANPNTVIKSGVTIQHGVTFGELKGHDAPVIEEGVYIGAKATILGGVTVGKGAKVGACALVIKDVPPGATVVGVPAKVASKDEPKEKS